MGYEGGEKVQQLINMMNLIPGEQAQQEIGIQQIMAQLQAQAGQGSVEAAMKLWEMQNKLAEAQKGRDLDLQLAEMSKTSEVSPYSFESVGPSSSAYKFNEQTGEYEAIQRPGGGNPKTTYT